MQLWGVISEPLHKHVLNLKMPVDSLIATPITSCLFKQFSPEYTLHNAEENLSSEPAHDPSVNRRIALRPIEVSSPKGSSRHI